MKQWCRVKLKDSELYMGNSLAQEVERKLAPIETHDAAAHRAERRFGRNWPRFVEIIEIDDYSEVQAWRGRKGGKKVTTFKRRRWTERFGLKWMTGKITVRENRKFKKVRLLVGARSSHHASEILDKVGMKRCAQTILDKFRVIRFLPWKHYYVHPEEGVWKRDETTKEWHRIL